MGIKIAALQMSIRDGDRDGNLEEAERLIDQAAKEGAEVLCLPEMWPTGFDYASLLAKAEPVPGPITVFLSEKAAEKGVVILGGSIPERDEDRVYNTAVVFGKNGGLLTSYRKMHLFTLMNEQKYLAGGDVPATFPLGDATAAVVICYDLRFPELFRALITRGVKIIFHPAEFPHPRLHHWRTLIQARAIENQVFMVSTNRSGPGTGGNVFFGHSMIVDPWGEIVAEGGEAPEIVTAEIDLTLVDRVRSSLTSLEDIRRDIFSLDPRN
ncbi:MAG: carbon-nitrogen family hydrolase [Spirochaetales bacterium]|nr:carbon-nitrogen family hydrolase [Spirochaetales bacterium]